MAEKMERGGSDSSGFRRMSFEELFGKKGKEKKQRDRALSEDLYWKYTDKDGNTTDYTQALERARVHEDPMGFAISGKRDMRANIEKEKKQKGQGEINEEARNAAIDSRIMETQAMMDALGTDQLSVLVNGYSMVFQRTPVENGTEHITVDGEKAFVQEELPGGTAGIVAGKMQVSMDMVDEAMKDGPQSGVISWKKDLSGGNRVRIDAVLRADDRAVNIDESLTGDEIKIIPEGMLISPDIWEEGCRHMQEYGRTRWLSTLDDGRVVDLGFDVKVNGKEASVSDKEGQPVSGSGQKPVVSRQRWNDLRRDMLQQGSKTAVMTLEDGTKVTAKLTMRVDRKEAYIDRNLTGMEVRKVPSEIRISPERWEEVKNGMIDAAQYGGIYKGILPDGSIMDGRMSLMVNGREAFPNLPLMEMEVRREEGRTVISGDLYDRLKENAGSKTVHEMRLRDGTRLGLRREAELTAAARSGKGVEVFRGNDMREAVAEANAMNTDKEREAREKEAAKRKEQSIFGHETGKANMSSRVIGGAVRKTEQVVKEERREAKTAAESLIRRGSHFLDKGVSLGR